MENNNRKQKIDELLSRSVEEILPSKEALRYLLISDKKLRVYIGADATGPSLHIGHATNYMILEKFRRLGHKVFILIGDFTARIGDPTDKTAARIQLTRKEVAENTKTWLKQLEPIIDIYNKENPVEIVYNNDWLSKMSFEDVIGLASNFTVQQMLERDMFETRMRENKPIYVHEFFYPLMQGYDSVHLDVDIELCGSDQTFNALVGRTLVRRYKNKEKFVFVTNLLENPVTKEKMMSKSQGTGVFLDMSPGDMFGRIMSQPDENINQLFIDCTYLDLDEIETIRKITATGGNPRDAKMRLAREIVKIYHGDGEAKKAEDNFIKTFQKKEIPDDIREVPAKKGELLSDTLFLAGFVNSKSDFRRLVDEGAITINGEKLEDFSAKIEELPAVIKVGKKKFIKLTV